MIMLSNDVLYASQFVEYATGNYYFDCSTFNEVNNCYWNGTGKPMCNPYDLKDINKIPENAYVCIVQFSKPNDYADHEYKIIRLHKNLVKKFIERMESETNA